MFAGAIADNFDRRRVMLIAQFGMLVTSAVLALITYEQIIGPYSLLALSLLVGIVTALNAPAWQASVRAQVGRKDLPQAISLNSVAFNLARSVGPALGGILISLWDISLAFAINALSYIFLIVVLLRWRPDVPPPTRGAMFISIATGVRFCVTSQPVRKVLLRGATIGVGCAAYQALLPIIVREQIRGDEFDFGLLLGAFGIASIVSALFVAQVILAVSPSLLLAMLAAFAAGAGWVFALTTLNVAMQMRSPETILGRCLSIYQAATFGGIAIGSWFWGTIAEKSGAPVALILAAAWLVLSLIIFRFLAPMPKKDEGIPLSQPTSAD